jgi:hypothetical protein
MPVLSRLLSWRTPAFLPRSSRARLVAAPIPPRPVGERTATLPPAANDAPGTDEVRSLAERRGEALRAMFPMLFSLYARRSDLWQAIAIERYLAQSANLAELEQRIRQIEQRRQFSWSE